VAHLAVLQLPEQVSRDGFRSQMQELGIQTEIHYPMLDCDQVGLNKSPIEPELHISKLASKSIISIPLFPELTTDEIEQISKVLSSNLV
jgi:dTDP-4-amino-4,6-dideoxygalactose transaminase